MLPDIGTMIAAYIILRCLEILIQQDKKAMVDIFAILTLIVTIVSWFDLVMHGVSASSLR